ncbi:MAG TPA: hypothetical protein VKV39_19165 [Candidatus Sulfotelmatobacter sp.]|nr:hypothetical protein [Candidatus Sulfotelmatobacter sp.]
MNQWASSMGFSRSVSVVREQEPEEAREFRVLRPVRPWTHERYAEEQIRGLVHQVFFSNSPGPIRHVLFAALEPEVEVRALCRKVGEALAAEDAGEVAVLGNFPCAAESPDQNPPESISASDPGSARRYSSRIRSNLWLVPDASVGHNAPVEWRSRTCDVIREFQFSIVQAPCFGVSQTAIAMAELVDGVILVVSERRSRRASAQHFMHVMEAAQVRMLGAVFIDRMFPIPEKIYRHL